MLSKTVDINVGNIVRKIGKYRYVLWDTTNNYLLSSSIKKATKKVRTKRYKI